MGADGFELDIHLTKDKELVVFHDYRLKRLMGVPGGVSSLDSREISQLSFAGNSGHADVKIPSLREVFENFGSARYYNIEVKSRLFHYDKIISNLLELLHEFGLEDNVWISSFDPVLLRKWHEMAPHVSAGFLFDKWNRLTRSVCEKKFAGLLHPGINLLPNMDELKQFARPLCFWTVNEPTDLKALLDQPVAGIITDDVAAARRFFPDVPD